MPPHMFSDGVIDALVSAVDRFQQSIAQENTTQYEGEVNNMETMHNQEALDDVILDTATDAYERILQIFDVNFGEPGTDSNMSAWINNKQALIRMLRKHPNWNEDALAIIMSVDEGRDLDEEKATKSFYGRLLYMLPPEHFLAFCENEEFGDFCKSGTASERLIEICNKMFSVKANTGMKTSRLLRKVFEKAGVNVNSSEFSVDYAQYADALSPYKMMRPFVLSVNPGDYLSMSNGTTWSSCHIINPEKAKGSGSYSGCYRLGTISYMNDGVSLVSYTVKEVPSDLRTLCEVEKVSRQMFHIDPGTGLILQSRLYPAGGDAPEFVKYRQAVQEIVSFCMGIPNLWSLKKGPDGTVEAGFYQNDNGHYPDYHYNASSGSGCTNNINVSYPSGFSDFEHRSIPIGSRTYCLTCGGHTYDCNSLHCGIRCAGAPRRTCYHCGNERDDDDMIMIDDEFYCMDCAEQCPDCGDWFMREDMTNVSNDPYDEHMVCQDCLRCHYIVCHMCGDYMRDDRYSSHRYHGEHYCNTCWENEFSRCGYCHDFHRTDDMEERDGLACCEGCEERLDREAENTPSSANDTPSLDPDALQALRSASQALEVTSRPFPLSGPIYVSSPTFSNW